jgi:hypothetical protein
MTHIPESEYMDLLEPKLKEWYGENSVDREVHMPDGRIADFLVETPLVNLAIEVENNEEDAITGTMQAVMYADHEKERAPVVILPELEEDRPEIQTMADQAAFVVIEPDSLH